MKNIDIKKYAKTRKVNLWEVSERLGYAHETAGDGMDGRIKVNDAAGFLHMDSQTLCLMIQQDLIPGATCFKRSESLTVKEKQAICARQDRLMLEKECWLELQGKLWYIMSTESHRAKAAPSCLLGGYYSPPDERKEGDAMYVTYADLIQIGILIVALISLLYQIFKGRK